MNSDRDWLFVGTRTVRGSTDRSAEPADTREFSDDIATLFYFLHGQPLAADKVRAAVVRILNSGWDTVGAGREFISALFTGQSSGLAKTPVWTISFKKTGRGRPLRDAARAVLIQACRDYGMSYDEAIEWAVEEFGIGDRRAKQIYGKEKGKIGRFRIRSGEIR